MKDAKHIIWTNDPYEIDMDAYAKELCEANEWDCSDEKAMDIAYECLDDDLDAERANLNITLHDRIIMIGNIGLWDGNYHGYNDTHCGNNIRDCLYSSCDYVTWYCDRLGDLRAEEVHHDGRNYILYRVWKRDVTETQKERLLDRILDGTATRRDITRYTERIGDYIGSVYGWKFPSRRRA